MITVLVVWLETTSDIELAELYIGTVLLDLVGISLTGVLLKVVLAC